MINSLLLRIRKTFIVDKFSRGCCLRIESVQSFSWHELMFSIWFTSIKELNPFVQLPALQTIIVLKLLIKKTQLQKSRSFSLRTLKKYFFIWNSTFFTIVLKFVKVGIKLVWYRLEGEEKRGQALWVEMRLLCSPNWLGKNVGDKKKWTELRQRVWNWSSSSPCYCWFYWRA